MLSILDRYIAAVILKYSAMVTVVILFLDAFFAFLIQIKRVAKNALYGYLDAVLYIGLQMPSKIVDLSPALVLIGTLLGMGALASNSEINAMRAAGMSKLKIIVSCFKTGAIIGAVLLLFSQFVTPFADVAAKRHIDTSLGRSVAKVHDFWSKNNDEYIRIASLDSKFNLTGVVIYKIEQGQLKTQQLVERAHYANGKWHLNQVQTINFAADKISQSNSPQLQRESLIDADIYKTMRKQPQNISLTDLYRYVSYLQSNNLQSANYQRALWKKLIQPFSILVMIFISMPFVFSNQRAGNAGARLVLGIVFGISYYIISELVGNMGMVYNVPAWLATILPVLIFMSFGVLLLLRQD